MQAWVWKLHGCTTMSQVPCRDLFGWRYNGGLSGLLVWIHQQRRHYKYDRMCEDTTGLSREPDRPA